MGAFEPFDISAGASGPPLLVVIGSDHEGAPGQGGRVRYAGISDFLKLLPDGLAVETLNLAKQMRAGKRALKVKQHLDLSRFHCVLNLVTDPDQHPRTLGVMKKLLAGYRGKVVNRPEAVLKTTRDQVALTLAGIECLTVPRVLRLRGGRPDAGLRAVERAGLRFPLLVRRSGTHSGKTVTFAEDGETLSAVIEEKGDYFATEFVEFASADGLYRKYRIFVFGGRVVLRHMLAGDNWNIHARQRVEFMACRQSLLEEEMLLFAGGNEPFPAPVQSVLRALAARFPLDFFGVDFGIDRRGQAVLFEANATMNFFPFMTDPRFDYVRQCIAPSRRAALDLLGIDAQLPEPA